MGYCLARLDRDRKEAVYRAYMTDALAAIAENTQRFAGGKAMRKRYADIAETRRKRSNPLDRYTGDKIMMEAVRRMSAAGFQVKNQ